jgi:hypothetical protein
VPVPEFVPVWPFTRTVPAVIVTPPEKVDVSVAPVSWSCVPFPDRVNVPFPTLTRLPPPVIDPAKVVEVLSLPTVKTGFASRVPRRTIPPAEPPSESDPIDWEKPTFPVSAAELVKYSDEESRTVTAVPTGRALTTPR